MNYMQFQQKFPMITNFILNCEKIGVFIDIRRLVNEMFTCIGHNLNN